MRRATLRRVTTIGNEWGGVGVYTSGKWFPIGVSTLDFVDLNVTEAKTFYAELNNFANPSSPAPATRLIAYRQQWK